jgi:hypothetical protein
MNKQLIQWVKASERLPDNENNFGKNYALKATLPTATIYDAGYIDLKGGFGEKVIFVGNHNFYKVHEIEWLEELPEDFFTSSPTEKEKHTAWISKGSNCSCGDPFCERFTPTEIQEVETEKEITASEFKRLALEELTKFYDLGDSTGYSNTELSRISSCIQKIKAIPTPLPDALQEVRGFQYFSEWLKTKTDIERAGDGYESLPEKSKHCIDFAVQRYVTFLTDKYPNPVQEVREKEEGGWIRFEDKKPEPGQPIWITWPSANYFPEYRELTETDLKQNWDMMFWLPVPPVPTPSAASNNNTEQNNQE